MTNKKHNIFQLEIIVADLNLWVLPANVLDSDESSVDFKYMDCINIRIDQNNFGTDSKKNGRNCMFTLDEIPEPDEKVYYNII